jgi:hypothetical protein
MRLSAKAFFQQHQEGEPRIVDTTPLCGSVDYTMLPKAGG